MKILRIALVLMTSTVGQSTTSLASTVTDATYTITNLATGKILGKLCQAAQGGSNVDMVRLKVFYSDIKGIQNNIYIETTPEIELGAVASGGSFSPLIGRKTSGGSTTSTQYTTNYYSVPVDSNKKFVQVDLFYRPVQTGRQQVGLNFDFNKGPPGKMKYLHIDRDFSSNCAQK